MKVTFLNTTFRGMAKVSSFLLISNIVLSSATLVLGYKLVTAEPLVRFVPLNLTKEAVIGTKTADAEYLMSYGMYIANLTGNLTPKNVLFVADALGSALDPAIYPEVRRQLFALAENPVFKERGASLFFEIEDVSVDVPTGKVFVKGNQIMQKTTGRPQRFPFVYEIQIEMREGRPWVIAMDKYEGRVEQSLMWEARHQKHLERRAKREARENAENVGEVEPWFSDRVLFGQGIEESTAEWDESIELNDPTQTVVE